MIEVAAWSDASMLIIDVADTGAGFVPGHRPLHHFLVEQGGTLLAGLSPERAQAATAQIATLTRQFQITASDQALAVLQRNGLRSAAQISAMPKRVFLTSYGAEFPTPAEAELTWRRAQQVTAVTLNVVTLAMQTTSARLVPALAVPEEAVSAAQAALVRQFPTLEPLFGSLDYCECEHCRSVLSPAAYLVDLLKLLDDAPALPTGPYAALTQRRPDLPHLPLTCENTLTPLPYIDLVNEVTDGTAKWKYIAAAYQDRLMEHANVVRAEVVTAVGLPADRMAALQHGLAQATGRQVQLESRVDPSIIGGAITRIGSTVYDGSVTRQLEKMKEALTAAGS